VKPSQAACQSQVQSSDAQSGVVVRDHLRVDQHGLARGGGGVDRNLELGERQSTRARQHTRLLDVGTGRDHGGEAEGAVMHPEVRVRVRVRVRPRAP
jgi:hypothetical protein